MVRIRKPKKYRFSWDKHEVYKTYRNLGNKRYKWKRKKTSEKKGHTRYSLGPKWAGQYDMYKPAFWRRMQPELYTDSSRILDNGYTKNQAWIALCKSWNGFMCAERNGEDEDMKEHAGAIRKMQKLLGIPLTEFYNYTEEELKEIDDAVDDRKQELRYATTV